jgi:trimeric autotransporter adhesin
MRSLTSVGLLLTLLFLGVLSSAQQTPTTSVPNLIRYGGVLRDAQGAALPGTTQGITFGIYKQQEGGAPVWLETQNVTPDATGRYSVLLGSTTATGLPSDLFSQQEQRWLGVQVQGQTEQPRVLLVSVPYAMKAAEADRLAGHSASEFVTTDTLQTAVRQQLQQQAPNGPSAPAINTTSTSVKTGMMPAVTNPATNFVDNTTNQVVQVQQNGTGVALIASAPTNTAIVGASKASAIAGIIAGVEAVTSVPTGYGLYARQMSATAPGVAPTGVYAQSDSPNGAGMRAWEPYGSGATFGLVGGAASTGGTAIQATETAITGATFGLVAKVLSPAGTAALILNNASGTITGPLIQAKTNAGVQFSLDGSGNVNAAGSFSGTQLISTVATGTSPLQVASTTLVPNLNASLLGGSPASAFASASGSNAYIQNGIAQQPSANFNISGEGSANSFSSSTNYQIGGTPVVGIPGTDNLYIGQNAGNSLSTGTDNTFSGFTSGANNSSGIINTFLGSRAGYSNTTGSTNTISGYAAGYSNTTGSGNAFFGASAGGHNITGDGNTFLGLSAGVSGTTGSENTFSGEGAGAFNTTGSLNTYVGANAGNNNVTGNNNIYIGNLGCGSYPCSEDDTIRIGGSNVFFGYGPQTAVYISGIYGSTSTGGIGVYVNSNGQLGTVLSSSRFKERIRDMDESSSGLMKLRPVTFLYKPEYDKGQRTLQYGLIAEEVAEVYPDLVAYEPDGKPYTVKYQYLTTMLLNEMQKQYHRADLQAELIKAQQQEIDSLKVQLRLQNAAFQERLSRLESIVGTQTQIAADLPHQ